MRAFSSSWARSRCCGPGTARTTTSRCASCGARCRTCRGRSRASRSTCGSCGSTWAARRDALSLSLSRKDGHGAVLAAALPGVAAAHTDLPVIGVPLTSSLTAAGGLDALLSIVQMPPGVPVATVGVDNAKNAAHLARRILSI